MSFAYLKMDTKGRITLGGEIRKRSIQPATDYRVEFGADQSIILTPVTLTITATPIERNDA